ncbi:MAG: flagellar biosynthesis protein FlhA [Microthrixaceae bacterium]
MPSFREWDMTSKRLGSSIFPAAIVFVVALMVIPMPAPVLDVLLTLNIAFAVLILLAAIGASRALDLSAFPSLLLIATLFRLGLNVSSTRLILGQGSAGTVIEAFGHFVIQGSLVVGLVVFFILVVIQFVVVTNGSNRVAEVAARFTLDAMPGKQMAIDADLNAGVIDDDEARLRRAETSAEADFYGAMDGAGKFVKGDAIAGVIITTINLIGGFVIGVMQLGMSPGEAVNSFAVLTVGDGLVTQIPALLVSISSGLIVTRAAGNNDLGTSVMSQFSKQHKAMQTAGVAMLIMAIVPGMPKLPFLCVGGAMVLGSRRLANKAAEVQAEADAPPPAEPAPSPDDPAELVRSMRVDAISLELAVDLVDLVDTGVGGDLLDRVRGLRRKLALELGFVLPPVRTRDNMDLPLGTYVIRLHGVEVGRGVAPAGHFLFISDDLDRYPGEEIREAVFGLPSKWLPMELRRQAEVEDGTVVDRSSVISVHLAEICRNHAPDLLSRQDVKHLIDLVRESDPAVIEDLGAAQIGPGEVHAVLQSLLADLVPIRDIVRILEVISAQAKIARDTESLSEATRGALAAAICADRASNGSLSVLSLDPLLEQTLLQSLTRTEQGTTVSMDPDLAQALTTGLIDSVRSVEQADEHPVLVCSPPLRPALRRFSQRVIPHVSVLSFDELVPPFTVTDMGAIRVSIEP